MALPNGIQHVEQLPVEGRRVFVRVDLNVPLTKERAVSDDARIVAVLPTIRHLVERGARIVLGSHLGRPDGKVKPEFSLEPVAARLADLLDLDVVLADEPVGDGARKVVSDLRDGQIALLENLRFDPGEEANDDGFARQLASYADVYVNDAFGTAHRAHASTSGMVPYVAIRGAGYVMAKEIDVLSRLLGEVDRPYLAIVGGAKVSDKIEVLDALLTRVDQIAIGGAMANTFLTAQGRSLGKSKVESDKLHLARNFLRKASEAGKSVLLPTDVTVGKGLDDESPRVVGLDKLAADDMALDLGDESIAAYVAAASRARTVFWNGPMGVFEMDLFAAGTQTVAKALTECQGLTVVGGGDSAAAVRQLGFTDDQFGHISTGGGASLEYLEGKELPGIAILNG